MLTKQTQHYFLLLLTLLGLVLPMAATAQAPTTTTVASQTNPSQAGNSVNFTATVSAAVAGVAGTVQFSADGTPFGTPQAVAAGAGNSATTPAVADTFATAGPHTVTATFTPTTPATFNPSSGSVNQVVKAVTSINPFTATPAGSSVFGQSVTLSATVAGGFGMPTGAIQFSGPSGPVGPPVTLDNTGKAVLTTSALPVGTSYTITANYSGDSFNSNATGTLTYTVQKANTSVSTPTASPPSPSFGQAVTLSSTVSVTAPGAGAPTGTITFSDGAAFSQSGPVGSGGTATVTTSGLSVGAHNITATYNSDANFNASAPSGTLSLTVGADTTATGVTSSVNPSVFGQSVTFTVSVTNTAGTGVTPTGTVTLTYPNAGGTNTTTAAVMLNSTGQAQISVTDLAVGTDTVTAAYTASGNFAGSTASPLTQTVDAAVTTTSVASSANPASVNNSVMFTATVATQVPGAGTPTGSIIFTIKQGSATIYTSPAPIPVSGGGNAATASDSYTFTAIGNYVVTAAYTASGNFTGSSGRLSPDQQITPSTSTTVVVTSSSTSNTSVFGQPVTFTATIGGLSGAPSGQVQFFADGKQIGAPQPVDAATKTAHLTYPTQNADPPLAAGPHTITASYSGDPNNGSGSGSTLQTVNPAMTATMAMAAPSTSTFGQTVTFTATVTNTGDGTTGTGIAPTGTVTFSEGTTTLGSSNLKAVTTDATGNSATAAFSTAALSAGTHNITATFAPADANFSPTPRAAQVQQTVIAAKTTTAVTSTPNPSNLNQSVTFTATVANTGDGTNGGTGITPAGTVTFVDTSKNVTLGTASLSGNGNQATATFAATFASSGPHNITATYNPSGGNFQPSNATVMQSVNRASPTVQVSSNSPQNTSIYGQPVTFTAVVPGNGGVTPTGTVTFIDSVFGTLSTVPLSGGQASLTTSTSSTSMTGVPPALLAGPHTISVQYSGDNNFAKSTTDPNNPFVQTVTTAATATALSASPSPSNTSDTVMFTAVVTNTNGTGIAPNGMITLTDPFGILITSPPTPPATIGSGMLSPVTTDKSGNSAMVSISVPSLAQGVHNITATYTPANNPSSQSGNFGQSATVLSQTVFNGAAKTQGFNQTHLLVPGTIGYTNDGLSTTQLLKSTDPQRLDINVTGIVSPLVYFNGNQLSNVPTDGSTPLTVQIPASLAATAGIVPVRVVNANANPGVNADPQSIPINPVMALPAYPVSSTRAYRLFSLPYDYTGFSPYDIVQATALSTVGSATAPAVAVTPVIGAGGFQYDPVNELLNSTNPQVPALARFTLTPMDTTFLALYHWDPNQVRYLTTVPVAGTQADSVPFTLGQAFWAVGAIEPSAPFLGVTRIGTPAAFNPTGIPLQPGWNMVGDPFPYPVDLGSLAVSYQGVAISLYPNQKTPTSAISEGIVGPVFWSYEQAQDGTTGYQLNYSGLTGHSAMKPYEGYWFYSYQTCTLLVNTPPAAQ